VCAQDAAAPSSAPTSFLARARTCVDLLREHGTDRYGETRSPILVSILDVETRTCPENPLPLDERWRVTRRERRNPAGANLVADQPLFDVMRLLADVTGDASYAAFARRSVGWYMKHLVDDKGLFWWGWHRHYDVYRDVLDGHAGNHHEIHSTHRIVWDLLWEVDKAAVRREIEACWKWHVIDKATGEINRHADGQRGCDFAMSAGAFIHAFAFLHAKTSEKVWLERARLLADYYWARRNKTTDLFPDRPNAGKGRFDGSHFVTSITGPYCLALLEAWRLTQDDAFRDQAVAYLKAYARYGVDAATGKFHGTLNLDGTAVPGPRTTSGYAMYEPRGALDLWEPYVFGYQMPIYTAQAYVLAYEASGDAVLLETAKRFATWIAANLPPRSCDAASWYEGWAKEYAPHGAHAGKYGRTVSFFLHLWARTGEERYFALARRLAEVAVTSLEANGLFRGHPAKPYYEAVDGVGFLLRALVQLDLAIARRDDVRRRKALVVKTATGERRVRLDNW